MINKLDAVSHDGLRGEDHIYDVVGLGYGPANLALSIALREELEANGQPMDNSVWLEKSGSFAW